MRIFYILIFLLLVVVAVSGCIGQETNNNIKSQEEAIETMDEVSSGVEDVSSTLDEIDKSLGGG